VTWLYLALGVVALSLALGLVSRRRNAAGITTSRWGRLWRLWMSTLRLVWRRALHAVAGLFMNAAQRAALDKARAEAAGKEVLQTMGHMKGALMKLGQIVSFMDDTLPPEFQAELRKLQASAPPMPYELVESVIRLELGKEPDLAFAELERTAMAAASIGQVHRAVLPDGTRVAVKVQYPGVDRAIQADLQNYGLLMGAINMMTPTLDAKPIVDELTSRLSEELDYRSEADNVEVFRGIYDGHPQIVVPRVFRSHSSQRVLTTELLEGLPFYEFVEKGSDEDKRRAVETLHTFCFDSLYQHHIFNGDPHPGNYLFLPGGRVGFLDFGCVKRFEPAFLADFRQMNRLYLLQDRDAFYAQALKLRFILPNATEKVDRDWLYDYLRYYYLPILHDREFVFTADYCKRAVGVMFGPNMRKLNMPGDFVMLNRITFGLNSIFAQLGARANWHRMARRQYFEPGDAERWEANPPHPEMA